MGHLQQYGNSAKIEFEEIHVKVHSKGIFSVLNKT